jgi:hypothetical protein
MEISPKTFWCPLYGLRENGLFAVDYVQGTSLLVPIVFKIDRALA